MSIIKTEAKGYGVVQRDFMQMDISVYAKCVYTLLRTYSGDKTACYPSIKTICQDLMISKSSVIRAIKELENINMVAVKRSKKRDSNENSVNTYIPLSVMIEIDLEKVDLDTEDGRLGGVSQTPRGVSQTLGVVSEMDRNNNNIKNNIEDKYISASEQKKSSSKKEFKKPTIEEVIEFFKSKGVNDVLAKKAFEHYDMADWKDSKGNKVVNWKQKMNTNWISNNVDKPQYKYVEETLFSNGQKEKGWGGAQDSRMVM